MTGECTLTGSTDILPGQSKRFVEHNGRYRSILGGAEQAPGTDTRKEPDGTEKGGEVEEGERPE